MKWYATLCLEIYGKTWWKTMGDKCENCNFILVFQLDNFPVLNYHFAVRQSWTTKKNAEKGIHRLCTSRSRRSQQDSRRESLQSQSTVKRLSGESQKKREVHRRETIMIYGKSSREVRFHFLNLLFHRN